MVIDDQIDDHIDGNWQWLLNLDGWI